MTRRIQGRIRPRRFPWPVMALFLFSSSVVGGVVWLKGNPDSLAAAVIRMPPVAPIDPGLSAEAMRPMSDEEARPPLTLVPAPTQIPPASAVPGSALPTVPAVTNMTGQPAPVPGAPTRVSPVVAMNPPGTAPQRGRITAQIAAYIPANLPPAAEVPSWISYARPQVSTGGRPMIALVIDDMGPDVARSRRVAAFSGPLTLSWLPYAANLPAQTRAAHAHGHELMLHMPMEPLGSYGEQENQVLTLRLTPDEVRGRLTRDLSSFEGYVGINNHMGSRFTQDPERMAVVMDELRRRGLLWLDSRTTANSAGLPLAAGFEVPGIGRDIFLDDDSNPSHIRDRLAELESVSRRRGWAVAIGHPRDATIAALDRWLPEAAARGFVLVPLTQLVRMRNARPTLLPVAQGAHHG